MEEEYKAVVKFRSSEELNQVLTSLQHKNIHNKFLYFSFGKTNPIVEIKHVALCFQFCNVFLFYSFFVAIILNYLVSKY